MKEVKCKKCKKILGIQEETRMLVKGKVEVEFKANTCVFTCIRCGQKNIFEIELLTNNR